MFFLNFWMVQSFWTRFQFSAGAASKERRKPKPAPLRVGINVNETLMADKDKPAA
jgi:hypothetical protein